MAKKVREAIRLCSPGKNKKGKPTGYFVVTKKNKRAEGGKEKLKLMKFDPRAYNEKTGKTGMHLEFKEESMK